MWFRLKWDLLLIGVLVLGVVAGLVATIVNYQTLSAVVEDAR